MSDYSNAPMDDSTPSAPPKVDAEGYSPVTYIDRDGVHEIHMCLVCDQVPQNGHAPDCPWLADHERKQAAR